MLAWVKKMGTVFTERKSPTVTCENQKRADKKTDDEAATSSETQNERSLSNKVSMSIMVEMMEVNFLNCKKVNMLL